MKKSLLYLPLLVLILFSGCIKDRLTKTYSILVPVYKEKAEVYANIKSNPARAITSPGKIFITGNYIFLNEVNKGVHVIDNSNPSSPVIKTFIDIPGNIDIAVKGNTLYADLYSDLVVVDIANPLDAKFVRFIPHVFPERNYTNGFIADSNRVIVDWIKKDTTVDIRNSCYYCEKEFLYASDMSVNVAVGSAAASVPGIAGSMARFALVNDFLYTVNTSSLSAYDLSVQSYPVRTSTQNVGWNIETIYPFRNNLFVGSITGMFIYDISSPSLPVRVGSFSHATRCDPVIADNNYAFVTLRGGNLCGGQSSQLSVIDITNMQYPVLANNYSLTNPFGLAKDGNLLFVCDGTAGLKVFDASALPSLSLKRQINGFETYDVIAWNKALIVVAKEGLYQFDYSNPDNIVQKSKLFVDR